jgi:hypothetical protein
MTFRNKLSSFYGEELLATRTTPNMEGLPLSVVRDCLSYKFGATLNIWRQPAPSASRGRSMPWWPGTHLPRFTGLHTVIFHKIEPLMVTAARPSNQTIQIHYIPSPPSDNPFRSRRRKRVLFSQPSYTINLTIIKSYILWNDVNLLGESVDTTKKNTQTLIDVSKEVGLEVNKEN